MTVTTRSGWDLGVVMLQLGGALCRRVRTDDGSPGLPDWALLDQGGSTAPGRARAGLRPWGPTRHGGPGKHAATCLPGPPAATQHCATLCAVFIGIPCVPVMATAAMDATAVTTDGPDPRVCGAINSGSAVLGQVVRSPGMSPGPAGQFSGSPLEAHAGM